MLLRFYGHSEFRSEPKMPIMNAIRTMASVSCTLTRQRPIARLRPELAAPLDCCRECAATAGTVQRAVHYDVDRARIDSIGVGDRYDFAIPDATKLDGPRARKHGIAQTTARRGKSPGYTCRALAALFRPNRQVSKRRPPSAGGWRAEVPRPKSALKPYRATSGKIQGAASTR
jgi:hypothetical protein